MDTNGQGLVSRAIPKQSKESSSVCRVQCNAVLSTGGKSVDRLTMAYSCLGRVVEKGGVTRMTDLGFLDYNPWLVCPVKFSDSAWWIGYAGADPRAEVLLPLR